MNLAKIKKCGKGSNAFYLVSLFQENQATEVVRFDGYSQARFFAKQWRVTK